MFDSMAKRTQYGVMPEGEDYEWVMDYFSLKGIIECPYCGADNLMDFADECDSWSKK